MHCHARVTAFVVAAVATVAVGVVSLRPVIAQQTPAATAQKWPRSTEPFFELLPPIETTFRSRPPAETIAALDRLQPQIAASNAAIQSLAQLIRCQVLRRVPDLAAAERAALDARALGAKA